MSYIVVDFEFNQAFDFEDGGVTKLNPDCRFEIIQIGAIKLDNHLNIIDKFNVLVKPTIYKRIHPYVEKITGLENSSFKDSKTFIQAYQEFYEFMSDDIKDNILCVWGKSDIKALYRNLTYYKIAKEPIIIKYIDVQLLATDYLHYSKGGLIGLKNAVEALNLPTEEHFHDAFCDALYTAKVFKTINPKKFLIKIFNSGHM